MPGVEMIIDLPENVIDCACMRAREASLGTSEWIARVLMEVIRTNEIHHLRRDVIEWREELLS
jgi:hypothetical protein